MPLPDNKAIRNYPICRRCGSRFYRANDDSNRFCPGCRDTSDGMARGSLDDRLAVGFAMQSDDEIDLDDE